MNESEIVDLVEKTKVILIDEIRRRDSRIKDLESLLVEINR